MCAGCPVPLPVPLLLALSGWATQDNTDSSTGPLAEPALAVAESLPHRTQCTGAPDRRSGEAGCCCCGRTGRQAARSATAAGGAPAALCQRNQRDHGVVVRRVECCGVATAGRTRSCSKCSLVGPTVRRTRHRSPCPPPPPLEVRRRRHWRHCYIGRSDVRFGARAREGSPYEARAARRPLGDHLQCIFICDPQ